MPSVAVMAAPPWNRSDLVWSSSARPACDLQRRPPLPGSRLILPRCSRAVQVARGRGELNERLRFTLYCRDCRATHPAPALQRVCCFCCGACLACIMFRVYCECHICPARFTHVRTRSHLNSDPARLLCVRTRPSFDVARRTENWQRLREYACFPHAPTLGVTHCLRRGPRPKSPSSSSRLMPVL